MFLDGYNQVMGTYIYESERTNFCLLDILVIFIDGLKSLPKSIKDQKKIYEELDKVCKADTKK